MSVRESGSGHRHGAGWARLIVSVRAWLGIWPLAGLLCFWGLAGLVHAQPMPPQALSFQPAGPVSLAGAPHSITVVIDDSYPPYVFRDHAGRLQGIRKDVWDLWSARTGIKVNLVGMDWAKAQAQILTGRADVIDTMFETAARKGLYEFGPAYSDVEVPIYFHESIGGLSNTESLKGFTIGVKEGDACIDYLTNQGLESFRRYPSYEAVVDAAAVGEVRVFCEDKPPATYFLVRKQLEQQFRSTRPLYIGQFHWAVRKGDAATFKLVQDGFARITPAEMHDLQAHWLGSAIESPVVPVYLRDGVYAVLAVAVLALMLGAWNIGLRRRVQARTAQLSESLVQLTASKQETERTLAQLNATLEAIPDLLFELDLDGRYVDFRASRTDLLAAPPEDLRGRRVQDVMPPEAADGVMQALHEAAAQGASSGTHIKLPLPQGERWFELSVARKRMPGHGRDHFIMLSRDISDRKLAEQALARHGEELEKIVQERSRQLVLARDASEQASRAKSEFLSRMSHELRTPMNAILGFSQLIEMDAGSSPRTKGHVQEILRAGKHLLHLINDVLDLEQVEAGRVALNTEVVEVSELVGELLSLMQPLADKQQVRLHTGDMQGLAVMADAIRVRQIVLNLLSNAIKYNRVGGEVWLEAQVQAGQFVRISVRDTGMGIAERHLGLLFQPFNRLGAEAGPIEGTGIGLSLCRRLAELMRGSMGVRSQEGEGSVFWVDLPQAMPHVQALDAQGAGATMPAPMGPTKSGVLPSPRTATLLYVEDNPANLQLMTQIVSRHQGVSLISAPLGQLGLDLARAHRPDLILLDIHLPDMDGYAVLGQLRSKPETRNTPVIAVTANAMPMDVQRIRDAGFDDYVPKPIRVTHIDVLLHERLGSTLA
ncbi:transporter substrate-binding domain-containing protein [Aquabacterium sp. NJ1]|uniref:ATP-binding protein n=1 Tax=Aquabacterium sp. NJ1 TaxID=1538295 RepID=UPI000689AB1D|nr:transporter substrate-binding domain-containing protein [Aquabacterium sp. NJ1]